MPGMKELNDKVSLAEQVQSGEEGPIVLIYTSISLTPRS